MQDCDQTGGGDGPWRKHEGGTEGRTERTPTNIWGSQQAFAAQREMLEVVSKAAKPSAGDFQSKCLPATSDLLSKAQGKVDRKAKNFNVLQVCPPVSTRMTSTWAARS